MWERGQSEERENTLGPSQNEHSVKMNMHEICMH